jgi:2-oxoisovalerate dehydrogenase E2 component (dihydrolipoyl transacylase)
MGRYLFRLPDVGEGVAEAEITAWYVKLGDRIEEDQTLVDVMTDKATVDLTSPVCGVVVAIHGELGQLVAVGSTLVELDIEGQGNARADSAPVIARAAVAAPEPPASPPPKPGPAPETKPIPPAAAPKRPDVTARPADEAPVAAPATRRRAFELGIPLQFVSGAGPGGRITPEDLDAYIATRGASPAVASAPAQRTAVNEIKIIGLRRRIAERMQDAKRRIPHFSYVEEFDMTEIELLRRDLNEPRDGRPKLTLLPFFMRALAKLQPEFPQVNARYDDEAGLLRTYEGVHVGIATQTEGGLMVPVVRHVEALDLWDCARELTRITTAARDGSATRDELSGSTITLTSLGPLGGIAATPVINSPEVAIIGPNKLVDRPVVRGGQIVIRTLMNLSSSFDHRIVDGHDAARFVQRLKRLIERPALLFVDEG